MGSSTISLGLGLGGGKASTISGRPSGGGGLVNTYSCGFDNADDYMDVGSSGTVGTMSVWFKPDVAISASTSGGNTGYLTGFTGPSGPYGTGYAGIVLGGHTGSLSNELITFHTNSWMYAYTSPSASISTDWHHVAVRWSGSDYEIYLDGTNVKNTDANWGSGSKAEITYANLVVGKRIIGTYFYDGILDEVAVWHTALSASDTAALYNSGVPSDLTSLSPDGWWRMGDNDGGTGTTITDQGSGGHDGTLTNGPVFSTDGPS